MKTGFVVLCGLLLAVGVGGLLRKADTQAVADEDRAQAKAGRKRFYRQLYDPANFRPATPE